MLIYSVKWHIKCGEISFSSNDKKLCKVIHQDMITPDNPNKIFHKGITPYTIIDELINGD